MQELVNRLFNLLTEKAMMITTAESCTGGLLAGAITEVPGSSAYLERGYITYSNASKIDLLGVQAQTLNTYGAVSQETAQEMAEGALEKSRAQIALSVTGIAGPEGGSEKKPVGLVYIGCAMGQKHIIVHEHYFHGTRSEIRRQAVEAALKLAIQVIS